jgi:hypothetical protein
MIKAKEELDIIVKDLMEVADEHSDSAVKRIHRISSSFRSKLSEGGTFDKHGPFRTKFYQDIIDIANQVSWNLFAHDACFLMLSRTSVIFFLPLHRTG